MGEIVNWIYSFGADYGVNPLIFALLYFGTIPLSLLCFRRLVLNIAARKPWFWQAFGMFICFIGTYIYLFLAGKNIPTWVWYLVIIVMIASALRVAFQINQARQMK